MNIHFNVASARCYITEHLEGTETETSQEAALILSCLLNCSKTQLLTHPEKELTAGQQKTLQCVIERRKKGEPLQYIFGEADFWGHYFIVREGVLIPRPETELLVELALTFLTPESTDGTFLDWGTGSGCISVIMLMERPKLKAFMVEKNPRSLLTAQKNLVRHGVRDRAFLWHSQTPKDIPVARGELDLVISNPPYIPTSDITFLMREVRDHEPHMALDGGKDGMEHYRILFSIAPLWLKNEGVLLFEIGDERQAAVLRQTHWRSFTLIKELKDYAGGTRCMVWRHDSA